MSKEVSAMRVAQPARPSREDFHAEYDFACELLDAGAGLHKAVIGRASSREVKEAVRRFYAAMCVLPDRPDDVAEMLICLAGGPDSSPIVRAVRYAVRIEVILWPDDEGGLLLRAGGEISEDDLQRTMSGLRGPGAGLAKRALRDVAVQNTETERAQMQAEIARACQVCDLPDDAFASAMVGRAEELGQAAEIQGQPAKEKIATGTRPPITKEEANQAAMRLAERTPSFVKSGVRQWAKGIQEATGKTCSLGTVRKTTLWQETMKRTGRGRTRGPTPKAVSLTDKVEATAVRGEPQDILERLVADEEQAAAQAIEDSGMAPDAKAATTEKLRCGEMSPQQATEAARMYPPKKVGPVKHFRQL